MAALAFLRLRASLPLLVAWLTLAAFSGGCDGLFRPATPEQPSNVPPVPRDYSDPDATLATLALGLAAKGQNGGTEAYLDAFADERADGRVFRSFFDPADSAQRAQSATVTPWTLLREGTFYARFINNVHPADDFRMVWAPDEQNPLDDFGATEATIHRRYTVFAETQDGSTSTIVAIGLADLNFYLSPQQGRWVITLWNDRIDPDVGVNPEDPDQLTLGRRRLEL